jgi:hypothetical protein
VFLTDINSYRVIHGWYTIQVIYRVFVIIELNKCSIMCKIRIPRIIGTKNVRGDQKHNVAKRECYAHHDSATREDIMAALALGYSHVHYRGQAGTCTRCYLLSYLILVNVKHPVAEPLAKDPKI